MTRKAQRIELGRQQEMHNLVAEALVWIGIAGG